MADVRTFTVEPGPADPDVVASLLDALPSWFAQPDSNADYVEASARMPNYWARDAAGSPIGVLVLDRHFPETAEVHLMAVLPGWHRVGVGRALVSAAERDAWSDGARLLEVKTLGAAHPDPGYALTRLFYEGVGFLPLEETDELWEGTPCLIMVKPL